MPPVAPSPPNPALSPLGHYLLHPGQVTSEILHHLLHIIESIGKVAVPIALVIVGLPVGGGSPPPSGAGTEQLLGAQLVERSTPEAGDPLAVAGEGGDDLVRGLHPHEGRGFSFQCSIQAIEWPGGSHPPPPPPPALTDPDVTVSRCPAPVIQSQAVAPNVQWRRG